MLDNISIYFIGYITGIVTAIISFFVKDWYSTRRINGENVVPVARPREVQDALFIHVVPPEQSLEDKNCLVCMEEFTSKEAVVECTSCHTILGHASCLESWFQQKLSCPHCRTDFFL